MREQEDVRNLDWDDTELIRAYNRGMKIQEIAEGKNNKHEKMPLAKIVFICVKQNLISDTNNKNTFRVEFAL
ncbi:hypothetical protein TNCT_312631 [Trichonephila clavata]|uniref:Uncharacterized protein n=1 Tax=Trichonephila clavata TaxID=2740835 RepID=A0A8X6JMF6_TRICU|nr:hypothetical protein TNCT_312631 [Trichonephila clavata]